MKVELISYSNLGEKVCGIASKTCVSENIPGVDDDVSKSLRATISSGHESVLEHWSATFAISGVSRACLAQLSRHRLMSLSVLSQRYVNMDGFEYVMPESIKDNEGARDVFINCMTCINDIYCSLIEDYRIPAEDARAVLPNACTTNIVLTANARELRHIFALRCCTRAQEEIRELANKMLELVKEVAPTIFANAGPSCVATGRCQEGKKSCGKFKKHLNERESHEVL
jgi:thymidylate synthase (FAD)